MMARVPASAMNTPLRADEREGGSFGGSARSGLLVIDRKTTGCGPIFVCRDGYIGIVTNFAKPRSDIPSWLPGRFESAVLSRQEVAWHAATGHRWVLW